MAPLYKGDYTLKTSGIVTNSTVTILVTNVNFILIAIENRIFGFLRELHPRSFHGEFHIAGKGFQEIHKIISRLTT